MGLVSAIRSSCVCFLAAAAICAILLELPTRTSSDSVHMKQASTTVPLPSLAVAPRVQVAPQPPAASPVPRAAAARPASVRVVPQPQLRRSWTPPEASKSLPSNPWKCKLPSGGRWSTVSMPGLRSFQIAAYAGNDIVSNSVSHRHTWEQLDVRQFGRAGHACDIGGNIGFYTFALAKAGWNVTTFEAMPSNVALMEATLCANPDVAHRVDLHAVGLGDAPGRCRLMSDTMNVGDGIVVCGNQDPTKHIGAQFALRTEFEVKLFDDEFPKGRFAAQPIDFVKIDVEGFECKVFRGARQLLQQKPHKIQSEVWGTMQGCSPAQYLKLFSDAGYHITADAACSFDVGTRNLPIAGQIKDYWMCRDKA